MYLEAVGNSIRLFWDAYAAEHLSNIAQISIPPPSDGLLAAPAGSSSSAAPTSNNHEPGQTKTEEEEEEGLRMCGVSLEKILRSEFNKESKEAINNILGDKQHRMSNYIDEVQVALRKAAIEVRMTFNRRRVLVFIIST